MNSPESQERRENKMNATADKILLFGQTIEYIKSDVAEIKSDIKNLGTQYVTRTEFLPVQRIVYGLVSIIMVSVITAILALVITQ